MTISLIKVEINILSIIIIIIVSRSGVKAVPSPKGGRGRVERKEEDRLDRSNLEQCSILNNKRIMNRC